MRASKKIHFQSDRPEERQREKMEMGGKKKSDLMKTTAEVMAFPKAFTFAGGRRKVSGRYYYGMNNGYLH